MSYSDFRLKSRRLTVQARCVGEPIDFSDSNYREISCRDLAGSRSVAIDSVLRIVYVIYANETFPCVNSREIEFTYANSAAPIP